MGRKTLDAGLCMTGGRLPETGDEDVRDVADEGAG
jgi:hypothetical protein